MNNSSSTLSNSISKEENKYLQEKREMAENIINLTSRLLLDDEEVGAAVREEDRMASLLASVVEASVTTPITTNASIGITSGIGIGIGTNLNRSPASLHYSNSNSKPNSISVANSTNVPNVLLRSYQLQRASKYNPESISLKSTGGGIGIRTNRLPAVDWTQSRATFVNDAPLYTWRSSGVRLDYLEPFVENQVLTGNNGQNSKDFKKSSTTSYLSNSMCGYCCCFLNKSNELFISSVSPVQISAYLFLKITSKYHNIFNKWKLRYYTVDRWGFHSRKGRTNSPRGPHIRLIDFSDIISVVKIENTNYEFHLVRSDNTFLEFRATTEEIQNLMIERIQGHIDIMKRLSPDSKIECYKIARYYFYLFIYLFVSFVSFIYLFYYNNFIEEILMVVIVKNYLIIMIISIITILTILTIIIITIVIIVIYIMVQLLIHQKLHLENHLVIFYQFVTIFFIL